MKTLKKSILVMIALCAIFFVFVGCESTKNQNVETTNSEVVVPAENQNKNNSLKTEEEAVISDISLAPVTAESLTGGWTLYTMADKDAEYPISCSVTMSFAFDEETEIFGLAGINNYHGIVSIDGLDISFGPIGVTKMAGLPEDMETEDNFLRILSDVNKIGFTGNAEIEGYEELVLMNPKTGSVLCFVR